MSKKKHKFRGFAAIVLLAGGIALVKTSGCSCLDITKVIETVTPDTPTPTPSSNIEDDESRYEGPIGESGETRIFDVGEHIVYMKVSRIDFNEGDYVFNLPEGYDIIDHQFAIRRIYTEEFPYGYVEFYYINTCPVIAIADENGQFTTLGTTVEQDKVYVK